MNIGIIIHSKTGTTMKFADIIAMKLRKKAHTVDIIRLETNGPVQPSSARQTPQFTITNIPDCSRFDVLLVGGPVWAFTASPVIAVCLKALRNLSGKKVIPFVTMGFPLSGMGGSQAIALMNKMAGQAGAKVLPGKIIPKMFHNYQGLMETAAEEISAQVEAKE
jgi:flavodoxin